MWKLFLFIMFLCIMNSLYGDERFFDVGGVDLMPVSYEFNRSNDGSIDNGISISFINYYLENSKTGIGFEFIFPQYNFYFGKHSINIINFKAYWNMFKLLHYDYYGLVSHSSIFGPCISINYLNWYLPDELKINNIIYSISFRYSLRTYIVDVIFAPIINIEGGYKNINGLNNIYFSIQINLLSLLR